MKSRAAMIANVMKVHDIWKNETILLQSCIHPESINIYNSREIFSIWFGNYFLYKSPAFKNSSFVERIKLKKPLRISCVLIPLCYLHEKKLRPWLLLSLTQSLVQISCWITDLWLFLLLGLCMQRKGQRKGSIYFLQYSVLFYHCPFFLPPHST